MALPRSTSLWAALALAVLCAHAEAARLNYQLELTALHSDNINLSEDDPATETVVIPRLKFDFAEEGAAIELQARGELERRHYTQDEFDDETRGAFAGQVKWSLLPQRLSLVAEDYLSEQPISIRDGRSPGNLQRVNVFLAGPSLYARSHGGTDFRLDLRGADTYAEISPGFDSRRYSVGAVVERALSPASAVSLNLQSSKVDFDESDPGIIVDYDRHDAFVRYRTNHRRIGYEVDLGASRVSPKLGENETVTIARATVQWQINPDSRLRLRARQQISDEVQELIHRFSDPDEDLVPDLADTGTSLISGNAYKNRDVELDYRHTGERFSFRARPRDRKLEYFDDGSSDRTERSLWMAAGYRVRPSINVFATGMVREREFINRDERDVDNVYSVGVEYQMTRHWGMRAEAIRNKRDSNLEDPFYVENAALLTVWWKR